MSYLSFAWAGPSNLSAELAKPFQKISLHITHSTHGPDSATLWRADGTGVRIYSQMHDVEEKMEVGVLQFEIVHSIGFDQVVEEVSFGRVKSVSKLIIHESGTSAESGIALGVADSLEIVIVAASFPLAIAIRGDFPALNRVVQNMFSPEYPLESYIRTVLV